jgi:predicted dinucleotide-binding enzyme
MRVGLLGAGNIGKTLARTLAGAGHDVKVANSRGPHTIPAEALATVRRVVNMTAFAVGSAAQDPAANTEIAACGLKRAVVSQPLRFG